MTNEQILKDIDELIMTNRVFRNKYIVFAEDFHKHLRDTNILLGRIKTIINSEKKTITKV